MIGSKNVLLCGVSRWLALGLLSLSVAHAQDPATEAAAAPMTPHAAEIARLSAKSLLLGIAQAGDAMIAVGDRGNILLSGDGAKWEQVSSPVNVTLTAVSFADAKTGWIVGHDAAILRSEDGGRSWALQNFKPELGPLLNVLAIDAQNAYAIGGYGLFLATHDGGKRWDPVDAPPVRDDGLHLNSLIRLGNGALFIAGESALVATSADGQTWQRLTLPYDGSLFGALPRGERGALVFGLRGNVFITDDVASDQWTHVDIGTVQSMFGGAVLADGRAALVGADGEIAYIGADAQASHAKLQEGALGSGSLSGVLPWKGSLQVVGEDGVSRVELRR